jgi:hypothetical protein
MSVKFQRHHLGIVGHLTSRPKGRTPSAWSGYRNVHDLGLGNLQVTTMLHVVVLGNISS